MGGSWKTDLLHKRGEMCELQMAHPQWVLRTLVDVLFPFVILLITAAILGLYIT